MKPEEFDIAIEACLEGRLNEAEAAHLSALLEESAEARERYWELASIHGFLEQSLQQASLKVVTGQGSPDPHKLRIFSLKNPFAAAAAGILLGIFCASMVWAVAVPPSIKPAWESFELFFESFENSEEEPSPRVPNKAGQWYGNFSPGISETEIGMQAHRGEHAARFNPSPSRKFSYAWYIVDLADGEVLEENQTPLELDVSASFGSSGIEGPAHYQIRLVAFEQEPSEVRPIWNNESVLFNTALQHVGRNEIVTSSDGGWKKLRARLEIPPGSRSLLISLGAGGEQTDVEHYLDGVRVRIKAEPGTGVEAMQEAE